MRNCYLWLLSLLFLLACDEQIHLNAPYQDIWVVYGILDPADTVQYVRVSKAFLPEENALEFAAQHDPTLSGLNVTITGNGQVYQGIATDDFDREEGLFPESMTVYRFSTRGTQRLLPDQRYDITVTADSLEGFKLAAYTRIPPIPSISRPIVQGRFNHYCLPTARFEDSVEVVFRKRKQGPLSNEAMFYELRVAFDYQENGVSKQYQYGPTRIFDSNRGCSANHPDAICYLLNNGVVMNSMRSHFVDSTQYYTYLASPSCADAPFFVSKEVRISVTAMDSALGRYMLSTIPNFRNFNTVQPEVTNFTGTDKVFGVFGAITEDDTPVALTECARALLRLNGSRTLPDDCK